MGISTLESLTSHLPTQKLPLFVSSIVVSQCLVKSVFNVYVIITIQVFSLLYQTVYHEYFLIVLMFFLEFRVSSFFVCLFVNRFFFLFLLLCSSKIIQMNCKVLPKSILPQSTCQVMYWSISLSLPGDAIPLLSGLAAFETQCTGIILDLSLPLSCIRSSLSYITLPTFLVFSFVWWNTFLVTS